VPGRSGLSPRCRPWPWRAEPPACAGLSRRSVGWGAEPCPVPLPLSGATRGGVPRYFSLRICRSPAWNRWRPSAQALPRHGHGQIHTPSEAAGVCYWPPSLLPARFHHVPEPRGPSPPVPPAVHLHRHRGAPAAGRRGLRGRCTAAPAWQLRPGTVACAADRVLGDEDGRATSTVRAQTPAGATPRQQTLWNHGQRFWEKSSGFIEQDEPTPGRRLRLHGGTSTHDSGPARTPELNGSSPYATETTPEEEDDRDKGRPAGGLPRLPGVTKPIPGAHAAPRSRPDSGNLLPHCENHNTTGEVTQCGADRGDLPGDLQPREARAPSPPWHVRCRGVRTERSAWVPLLGGRQRWRRCRAPGRVGKQRAAVPAVAMAPRVGWGSRRGLSEPRRRPGWALHSRESTAPCRRPPLAAASRGGAVPSPRTLAPRGPSCSSTSFRSRSSVKAPKPTASRPLERYRGSGWSYSRNTSRFQLRYAYNVRLSILCQVSLQKNTFLPLNLQ